MDFVLDASVTMSGRCHNESAPSTETCLAVFRRQPQSRRRSGLWGEQTCSWRRGGADRLKEAQSRRFIELLLALPIVMGQPSPQPSAP